MNRIYLEDFDADIVNETRALVAVGATFLIVAGVTAAILISRFKN